MGGVHGPELADAASLVVYVVDDDDAVVDSLTDVLAFEGYRVEGFTDPGEALARLRGGARPSVMLLDMVMPVMNGEDVLAALAEAGVHIPVVLLSGLREPGFAASRADAVLPKPCSLEGLLATLERVLSRAR